MKDKFAELAKSLNQFITRALVCLAAAAQFAWPATASDFKGAPLVEISRPNPRGGCDDGLRPPATGGGTSPSLETAVETSVAVNPTNPKNIVAAWIGGYAQSIIAGVSFDGGKGWQRVAIPGITVCSGGTFLGAADPWLSFAPNGELYVISLPFFPYNAVAVNKSSDGGLHWSPPVFLANTPDKHNQPDYPRVTADPTDAGYVYATWNNQANGNRGQGILSRTTDGGHTWEPARIIYDPGTTDGATLGHIIKILPNGLLVDVFSEFKSADDGTHKGALLSVIRSADKGLTWSAPVRVAAIPVFSVTDPDTGVPVVNSSSCCPNPAVAIDANSGNLYITWEETSFSGGQYSSIAFAMSVDGGLSWSMPIQVNQTPSKIAPANRQAFLPSVAVAADGTIGASYYDFRFNDAEPSVPTDYWLVHCHPSAATPATNSANWRSEVRLTERSFDLEAAFGFLGAIFLGDYEGLAPAGNDFVSTFTKPDADNLESIFFRWVRP